jgi:hypothetical protein
VFFILPGLYINRPSFLDIERKCIIYGGKTFEGVAVDAIDIGKAGTYIIEYEYNTDSEETEIMLTRGLTHTRIAHKNKYMINCDIMGRKTITNVDKTTIYSNYSFKGFDVVYSKHDTNNNMICAGSIGGPNNSYIYSRLEDKQVSVFNGPNISIAKYDNLVSTLKNKD